MTNNQPEISPCVKDELINFLKDMQESMNWHYELQQLFLIPLQKFQADILKEWNEQ